MRHFRGGINTQASLKAEKIGRIMPTERGGNTMRKYFTVLSATFAMFSLPALAQSVCGQVYTNAVANVSVSTRHETELSYLFSEHCETSGELRRSSAGVDLTVPVGKINIGFKGSKSDAEEAMRDFCKTRQEDSEYNLETYDFDRTIVVEALKSLNQCIALENAGVTLSHSFQEPASVVIRADFDPAKTNLEFRGVTFDVSQGNCRSASLSKGPEMQRVTPETGAFKLEKSFSIICDRTSTDTSEGKKFQRFSFAMDTNHGTYSLVLPPEDLLGYDLSSQNKQRADQMAKENAELVRRMEGATARLHVLYYGGSDPGKPWQHVRCGRSVADRQEKTCEGKKVVSRKLSGGGGGECGWDRYIYACIDFPY